MRTGLQLIGCFLLLSTVFGFSDSKDPNDYLRKVLSNLENIESATYYEITESWYRGDTTALATYCKLLNEYNNPIDTFIGASFVSLDCEDTSKLHFAYDGVKKVDPYHEHNGLLIDDFTYNTFPFRPIKCPFFNYTKSIIKYALNTEDNITTELQDLGDHYYLKLIIDEERQVEFFGKAHHLPKPPIYMGEPLMVYEVWINKSNGLPYKVQRGADQYITITTCLEPEFNKLSIVDFQVSDYFPENYEIREYRPKNVTQTEVDLIGKKAPNWTLNDAYEQPVSLADIKSKVLLINFTGIGCGPCQLSIPFLKELRENFSTDDFELFAIES